MKHKYEELLKKHGLPDVRQWLDLDDELTLRDVRIGFSEKLASFTDMVHVLVHPEDVAAMNESSLFSESEHEALEVLYNRLVLLSKEALLVDIAATQEQEVALVKQLIGEWPELITEMKALVERTKDAYRAHKRTVFDTSYLG